MKKDTKRNVLLIGVVLFLLVIIVIMHIQYAVLFKDSQKGFAQRQEMKLNETQIKEVAQLFNGSVNLTEIKDYCHKERGSCIYYCRNLNVNNSLCESVFPLIRPDKR